MFSFLLCPSKLYVETLGVLTVRNEPCGTVNYNKCINCVWCCKDPVNLQLTAHCMPGKSLSNANREGVATYYTT